MWDSWGSIGSTAAQLHTFPRTHLRLQQQLKLSLQDALQITAIYHTHTRTVPQQLAAFLFHSHIMCISADRQTSGERKASDTFSSTSLRYSLLRASFPALFVYWITGYKHFLSASCTQFMCQTVQLRGNQLRPSSTIFLWYQSIRPLAYAQPFF